MCRMNHASNASPRLRAQERRRTYTTFSPPEEEQRQENHDPGNHENVIGHVPHVPR
jgi:hypothetical protein